MIDCLKGEGAGRKGGKFADWRASFVGVYVQLSLKLPNALAEVVENAICWDENGS